ncbi:MAG: hypothetical protein KF841_14175 [Phycisphaerae bacterium]|nr:hypothetical protein [Phycisphaerae bacterium]
MRTIIKPVGNPVAKLQRVFDRIRSNAVDARRWLGQIGLYVRREAQRSLRTRTREWGPSSGRLSRSLAIAIDAASVAVGSNLIYARIQQLGGPVEPKGHKYLALPVPANLRRRGVWPRDLPSDSMRFVPNAEIQIGTKKWIGPALVRSENVTVPGKTKADGTPGKDRIVKRAGEVMFALVKRVNIKGRPYLKFDSKAQAFALSIATKHFGRVLGKRTNNAGQ